ncbi:MAG: response regulator transcription factor [Oscillospiraceae bacterium]
MNCVLFEKDKTKLEEISRLCTACGVRVEASFIDACAGVEFLRQNKVDLVLIDWEMPEISGIAIGRLLRSFSPETRFIYLSTTDVEAQMVYATKANGYLKKPLEAERLQQYISEFAAELRAEKQQEKRKEVIIHTFGHFDVYVDGQPVFFRNSRSKEMLAMLVDRHGGIMSMNQFMEQFWPDHPVSEQNKAIYRKAAAALKKTLAEYGIGYILYSKRNQKALSTSMVSCDYYRFLSGEKAALSLYHGEYMVDYTWAEDTNGKLWRLSRYQGDM